MAVETLTGVGVTVAGTDLSNRVKSVTIDDGREEHDDTVMSHLARSVFGGLPTPSVTITFLQDYAAANVHEVLRAAVNVSTAVIVRLKASVARSATNPEWQFTGKLMSYQPIDGPVGALQERSVTFRSTGTPFTYLTTAT